MKLQRAIAVYLTDRIPGLHAFKDDLAFIAAGNPYPYFLIDLISTRRKAVGTGLWDRVAESEGGGIATKAVSVHQVLRFTVRASDTAQQNGNAVVAETCDQIETLLCELCRAGSVNITDPESGESLHIERTLFQGRHDIRPIEKGMPFVYQQALSFLFVEQRLLRKSVPERLNKIRLSIR